MISYFGPCGKCRTFRFSDGKCRCMGAPALDQVKAYAFTWSKGLLTIVAPGDPIQWRFRVASEASARQQIPHLINQLKQGKVPLEAVHRGRASEMAKGLSFRVAVSLHVFRR